MNPDVRHLDGRQWQLIAPWSWRGVTIPILRRKGHDGKEYRLGFKTDGGSVPAFVPRGLVDTEGDLFNAFVVHDYRYAFPNQIEGIKGDKRKFADKELKENCKVLGAPKWRCELIYRAVRIGGWFVWRKAQLLGRHNSEKYHYARIDDR